MQQADPLSAQIEQVIIEPTGTVMVRLALSSTDDQPVSQASIALNASMPAMPLEPQTTRLQVLGSGHYLAHFDLSMSGLWQLSFAISAPGFVSARPSLTLQVNAAAAEWVS